MTRPQFLQPQGELDVQMVGDVISLTDCIPPCVAEIEAWTPLERLLVYDWAMREHLSASDNKTRRRPKPFLLERVGGAMDQISQLQARVAALEELCKMHGIGEYEQAGPDNPTPTEDDDGDDTVH